MLSTRQLILFDDVSPKLYLAELLRLYPYDIEESLVYSLLKKNPSPHYALLAFIDYIRHIRKYRIIKNAQDDARMHALFTTMCKVSQRNHMVLHLHQFQFNASLYTQVHCIYNPYAHLPLEKIIFIDHIDLHIPPTIEMSSTYINKTIEISQTFLYRDLSIDVHDYFALSIQICDVHGIIFIPRTHIGFLCACASLYQICQPTLSNDFFLILSFADPKETMRIYCDITNEMQLGLITGEKQFDNFAYIKDMISTLYNSISLKKHDYPIHATMLSIHFPTSNFGLLLCGEQHTGKSEVMDALVHLCDQQAISYTKVFDDQGTLHYLDRDIYATGTEIGAYIGIDDLPHCSIFENLNASIILNVKHRTTHLLIPFTAYEDTQHFHKVDQCIYLDVKTKKKGYEMLDDLDQAKTIFQCTQTIPFTHASVLTQTAQIKYAILEEFINIMFVNAIEVGIYYTHHTPYLKERFYAQCAKELLTHIQNQINEN